MNEVVVTKLIECAFTLLTIVITSVLLPALTAWLKSKTNNEKLKGMVDDISQTVRTCVDCCEQTTVAALKKSGKPKPLESRGCPRYGYSAYALGAYT